LYDQSVDNLTWHAGLNDASDYSTINAAVQTRQTVLLTDRQEPGTLSTLSLY